MKLHTSACGAFGRFALTHVAAATLALASSGALGLGLGRLSVQSSLGETLKAEIDITSLSAEEAGTLKVRIAPPESYRSTGVEYNPVLTGTQVQVQRRGDRSVLRVSSDRAVQEPFVDVILELSWASGRLVREYTLLFDPPSNPKPVVAPPAVATAPVIAPAPTEASTAAVPAAPPAVAVALPPAAAPSRPAPRPRVEPKPEVRAEVPATTPAPAPAPAPRPAPRPPSMAASEYTVKPGDTLSRVASKTQAPGISLDQMLVGLYRSNPDAFIGSNMNRLKAGAVLQVPDSEALSGVSTGEAREVIQTQSADFSAYRQRLAGAAPTLKPEGNERQSKGQVQAAVDDRKPAAAPTPDKLTLSKAASAATEAKASKDTEKKDAAARVAELTRNVEELKKLSSAAKPAPAAVPAAPAVAPAPAPVVVAAVPAPAPEPAPAPAVVASAPASLPAPAPVIAAAPLPPASSASTPAALPPAAVAEEPGLLDQLLSSSLLLPLGAVLIAALGGLGLYRMRGRKAAAKADTGFHESRLQPDSFFGATGGQRVDTRDASSSGGSSMSYSLSQLDAIGDVDPVAEADVYLAYGRDLQAEEILKEALRANPERLAIRLKLLEVYAKRRDTKGFEQLAIQLYAETHGVGEDWGKAQELGRQIDAENPLYQPGGAPSQPDHGPTIHPEPMNASTLPHTVTAGAHMATEPLGRSSAPDTGPMSGFDLDLDLDLGTPTVAMPMSPISMDATQAMATTVEQAPLAMDFDLSAPPTEPGNDLQFDLDDFGGDDEPAGASPAAAADANSLDFDLSSIDLDLPPPRDSIPTAEVTALDGLPTLDQAGDQLTQALGELEDEDGEEGEDGDPLMRQLELADEFRQIGDTEGAREVLQELIAKSSGSLRDKAQAMLAGLR